MVEFDPPFRPARPVDAAALAELVDMAGEGLPLYLWERMVGPGESAWEVGRQRALRDQGAFSWRNAVVAEGEDGQVAGCLIGYPLPEVAEPIPPDLPAMLVPLQELENAAPGTWYVNVLAVYPRVRGAGLGSRLLALAERIAGDRGLHGLSIIVSDASAGARRLYERLGYRQAETRPMVTEGWRTPGRTWVLLTKRLSPARRQE